jgi:hypothetical protein
MAAALRSEADAATLVSWQPALERTRNPAKSPIWMLSNDDGCFRRSGNGRFIGLNSP